MFARLTPRSFFLSFVAESGGQTSDGGSKQGTFIHPFIHLHHSVRNSSTSLIESSPRPLLSSSFPRSIRRRQLRWSCCHETFDPIQGTYFPSSPQPSLFPLLDPTPRQIRRDSHTPPPFLSPLSLLRPDVKLHGSRWIRRRRSGWFFEQQHVDGLVSSPSFPIRLDSSRSLTDQPSLLLLLFGFEQGWRSSSCRLSQLPYERNSDDHDHE